MSLFYFPLIATYGQTKNLSISIRGHVQDSATKTKLSHVTVEVQATGKKAFHQSILTDEKGVFALTVLSYKPHQLTFTSIGYKTKMIQLSSFTSSQIDLGQILLVSLAQQLKEVQVVAQKPVVEQDLDKITYNLDADPESKTSTVFEILRKIPMLSTDADDNIQMNGNNNYRVLINGTPSSLFSNNSSEIFKNMPANIVKAVEVITIPSSRYESQGVGGIINIITYKKSIGGYNGGTNVRVSTPKSMSISGIMSATLGKFSISGNYGYNNNTSPTNTSTFSRQDKIRNDRLQHTGRGNNISRFQNFGSELTYEINSLNLITASYSINKGKSNNDFTQETFLWDASAILREAHKSLNLGINKSYGNDFGIDYRRSFKKNNEQQLSLSYKCSNSSNSSPSNFIIEPIFNYRGRVSTTDNNDKFKEYTLQVNYVQPIKKHTLELGGHSIHRQNNSDYFYKNKDTLTGKFVLDTAQSNNFNYTENIFAAYVSLNLKTGKWGLRIGTRLEQANVYAQFVSSGTIADKTYRNLMPNLTLARQLKSSSLLKLSYSQRIQRPNLYYLNPYVDRADPWNISYGNPSLQPSLSHVFNLAYNTFIKKTSFNISVFHQFTTNSIQQFTTLDRDTIARTTFGNIGKNRNTSLALNVNTTFVKRLSLNLNSNLNYVQYTSTIMGKPHKNAGLTYNISSSVSYRYKGWHTSSNLGYNAPNVLVQGKTAGYLSNSININKYFLKNNKASIGLSVTSPFREYRHSFTEINDPTFYQMRELFSVVRRFNFSVNYNFTKVQATNSNKN